MTWGSGSEIYRFANESDLPAIVEMLCDREVGRWLWFTPLPPDDIEAYFRPFFERQEAVLERGDQPKTAVFTVEDPDGGYLGEGASVAVEGSPLGFEIGFQLARHAWGRGVGTRLGRFLAAYAIHLGDAYRLQASCLEGNVASRRILEGLGLVVEGALADYRLKEGARHTELLLGRRVEELDREKIDEAARLAGLV